MAGGRQINDGQAPVRKEHPGCGIAPHAGVVRPAVRDGARHARGDLFARFPPGGPAEIDKSRYAAHGEYPDKACSVAVNRVEVRVGETELFYNT